MMEHESDGPWYYEQVGLSTNYRITDIQAALIESQLDKLPAFAARKKALKKKYDEAFGAMPELTIQKGNSGIGFRPSSICPAAESGSAHDKQKTVL